MYLFRVCIEVQGLKMSWSNFCHCIDCNWKAIFPASNYKNCHCFLWQIFFFLHRSIRKQLHKLGHSFLSWYAIGKSSESIILFIYFTVMIFSWIFQCRPCLPKVRGIGVRTEWYLLTSQPCFTKYESNSLNTGISSLLFMLVWHVKVGYE